MEELSPAFLQSVPRLADISRYARMRTPPGRGKRGPRNVAECGLAAAQLVSTHSFR